MASVNSLYEFLKNKYAANEPIFLAEIKIPDKSDASIRQQIKKLTEDGRLKRFDTGIYYLPQKSLFRSGSTLSVDDVIRRKYLMDGTSRCGYLGGILFANQLGLTTQVPGVYEVYSNKATTDYRETQLASLRIILRKPYVKVDDENAAVLQLLDLLKEIMEVSEVEGNLGGVTYDTTKYTFNVSVEYDEDAGKLTATMSNADGMEFINTYKAADVTINLVAHKTLEGADLSEGEFAFVVENEAGEVVATGTNDASGNVTFGGLTFTEEGTYTYRIKEVNTEVENITYDDSVYTVTVTVTDDKNGNLVAKASVDGGSANFINTFTPPEEDEEVPPKTPGVKTGDDNNIGGWLGLMALAAAGASGLYIRRRREDQE